MIELIWLNPDWIEFIYWSQGRLVSSGEVLNFTDDEDKKRIIAYVKEHSTQKPV
jgi:hypothetical protein